MAKKTRELKYVGIEGGYISSNEVIKKTSRKLFGGKPNLKAISIFNETALEGILQSQNIISGITFRGHNDDKELYVIKTDDGKLYSIEDAAQGFMEKMIVVYEIVSEKIISNIATLEAGKKLSYDYQIDAELHNKGGVFMPVAYIQKSNYTGPKYSKK
jgi:hypothetical protein